MTSKITPTQLRSIPLFANVEDNILEELAPLADIVSYSKDDTIFFLEDHITTFYIIQTGLVRTYDLDEKGNEATLQILSRYQSINNMLGHDATICAQAIQNCSVIRFKAENISHYLQHHPTLAINFAQEMMQRNKSLLAQLSRSRLLSAKEKLGRFLLELSFIEDGKKSLEINLQYSKSIIASYLGMNLETFSRALKRLKDDDEIAILGNRITFLKQESLCDYCDEDIASTCNNRGENYCKYD